MNVRTNPATEIVTKTVVPETYDIMGLSRDEIIAIRRMADYYVAAFAVTLPAATAAGARFGDSLPFSGYPSDWSTCFLPK